MKKSWKIWSLLILIVMVMGLSACKNWQTGGLFNNVEEQVKIANAEKIDLYVRFADNAFGKTYPSGQDTKKVGVSFSVSAEPENAYGFYKWAAFSSEDVNPKKNTSALVYNEEYATKYAPKELADTIVKFETPFAESTNVCVMQTRQDIVIIPIVARKADKNDRNTFPKVGATDVVRNQRIVIAFDKNMDFSSFVTCTTESGEYPVDENGNKIYYTTDESGNTTYYYTWDPEKVRVQVYDGNGNEVSEEAAYAYFNLPVSDSSDARKIIITPNLQNKLPRYAEIDITISTEVLDYAGYPIKNKIEYYYTVGKNDDEGYPIFTEVKGGRPRKDSSIVNDWSDYSGFLDESDSISDDLPADSTNIDDWNDTLKNKPFAHRVTNAVDLYVIIKDTIDSKLTPNNTSTAQDIQNFTIRAKHLLNADGTPGTGLVYENIEGKSYDAMVYHDGGKYFDVDEPGDQYADPDEGYAFPYYLPENIPDGLIKIELYAQDITGNSGEKKPFALYIVKDTNAPDLGSQTDRIKSAQANVLDEKWFNKETIEQLAFKVNANNPISDTVLIDGNIKPVHEKFMAEGTNSALYWAFGSSPENMTAKQKIDKTGIQTYDMSALVSSVTEEGAMTFYAQISDDMGNISDIKKIPMEIYFDTVKPADANIIVPDMNNAATRISISPEQGINGGGEGLYYTRDTGVKLTLSSTDSGFVHSTEKSSGVAGYLVLDSVQSEAQMKSKLVATNKVLPGLVSATDGKSEYTFAAGSQANASEKTHYVYTVDTALNASANPSKITVVQDTTGPGITLTDSASYVYNAQISYFKAKADNYVKTAEKGVTGKVQGVSKGKYYYNKNQTAFPFTVKLNNEFDPYDSGAYYFAVYKDGTQKEIDSNSTNQEINLSEGVYKICAKDKLGNETWSDSIVIVQDKNVPSYTNGSLKIYGRKFGFSEYNTETTNYSNVFIKFSVKDNGDADTGIRKLAFTGADFTKNTLIVKAGENTLVKNTDYIVKTTAGETPVTEIIFTEPSLEENFTIENIYLSEGDGTKVIAMTVQDASGNIRGATAQDAISASIFADSAAPTLTSVSNIALVSDREGNDRLTTKDDVIKVEIKAHDATSGILKFYIVDTASNLVSEDSNEVPAGTKLILNGAEIYAGGTKLNTRVNNGYIELESPRISSVDETFIITNVKLPETSRQGTQTVHVVLFDNTYLRNMNSKSASIIYDTTGPKLSVEDNASYQYNGTTLKKFRSTDSVSDKDDVAAVTGTTGNITGLYKGDYFYSLSEEGFAFTVTVQDENITNNTLNASGTSSGAYKFYVDDAETSLKNSGDTVILPEGSHTITALDKLGNKTVSHSIKVKLDKANPSVSNVVIHGKRNDESESTGSTIQDNVFVTFAVSDIDSAKNDTGLLKLTVSGNADFSGASLWDGDSEVTSGTVVKKVSENKNSVEFWFHIPVTTAKNYTVKNVALDASNGIKTISVTGTDRTGNQCSAVSNAIIRDKAKPVISNVVIISDEAEALNEGISTRVTKDKKVTVEFQAFDLNSGIKEIYINDSTAKNESGLLLPSGHTLLTDTSVLQRVTVNSEGTETVTAVEGASYNSALGKITLADGKQIVSAAKEKFRVTNVMLPRTDYADESTVTEGINNLYVVLYDEVLSRNDAAEKGFIIYDITPPVPVVNLYASEYFNPKIAYSAYVKNGGTKVDDKFAQVLHKGADQNIIWNTTGYVYITPNGTDEGTDNAGYWKTVYENSATKNDVADFQKLTVSDNPYLLSAVDSIGNASTPSESTLTKFYVKKDTDGPSVTEFKYINAEGDAPYKDGSRTNTWHTNKDTVGFQFKVNDSTSGVSYFDLSTSNAYYTLKNGSFVNGTGVDDRNPRLAEFLSYSKDIEVSVDGHRYYLGGFVTENESGKKINTGVYTSGDSLYKYYAIYNSETGKWTTNDTHEETEYVYFNAYFNNLECFDDYSGYRCYGFYKPLSAGTEHTVTVQGINLSVLKQSTVSMNIYAYDLVFNNGGITGQNIIYDPVAPEISATYFKNSSGAVQFASAPVLENHDLVIKFVENHYNSFSYSGINKIEVELTSDTADAIASGHSLSGSSEKFKVYLMSTDSVLSSDSATSSYSKVENVDVISEGYNKSKLVIKLDDSARTNTYAYTSSSPVYRYVVIKGLTIAGGKDQTETIKVTLTDRAGNVSDNTGNTNNETSIGFDISEPKMHPVYGNETIDGKLARSYFKTVFGKPAVLSLHHATSNTDVTKIFGNTAIADNMVFNIFPEPGDGIQNYGDVSYAYAEKGNPGDEWQTHSDKTELVLRFNKNGSGIRTIKLGIEGSDANTDFAFRRILFNPSKVQVSIDEGEHWYSEGNAALPFTVTSDTLTFTDPSICPKGENCSVMIKGVMPNFKATYFRNNADYNSENIWWSDVSVTSQAGKESVYHYALALADDVDTAEFVRQKISVTDTSSTDTSFTDGKTIKITGRVQSKSTHSIYSSGLWAIQLTGAEFDTTASPSLSASVTVPTTDRSLLLSNKSDLANKDSITFNYDSLNDYSVRRTVNRLTTDSEVKVNIRPASYKCSISSDNKTMYLNMPFDPHEEYDFTLTGIKLLDSALDGTHDGAQDISVKLIKYSGLTNDPKDRYWDYDETKETNEYYKEIWREAEAYYNYSSSLKHREGSNFANNGKSNSDNGNAITLDTKDPVIVWNGIDDSSDYYHSYKDSETEIVYYPNSTYVRLSYSMTDTDGSGIYGYRFDTNSTATATSTYTTGTSNIQSLIGLDTNSFKGYLHIMDKVGHIVSRPVTYESDAEKPNPTEPTTWKCDEIAPSIKPGVTRHYYNDSTKLGYVLKTSSSGLQVYLKGGVTNVTGSFSDTPVSGETGGVDQFFTDNGSGLYGTGKSTSTYYKNIWTDFKWSTENTSLYIYDNVGNYNSTSFTVSKVNDSVPPNLTLTSITAPDGKTLYRTFADSAISDDSSAPSVIYLNSTAAADGVTLTFSAADTEPNATGVYKVTVGGTGLTADSDGATATLANTTSLTTTPTTATWNLGKGESKSEGSDNGLVRSITVTDWVGNSHTYWFKLVSDVTAPVLTVSADAPFASHAYANTTGNKYFTSFTGGKQVLFFGEYSQEVDLSATGFTDAVSGLPSSVLWYSDEACTTSVSKILLEQPVTWDGWAAVYGTPTATPSIIYTKDNVGNLLTVNLTAIDTESLDSAAAGVYFCFTSVNTAAKIKVGTGQYIDGTSEVSLSSESPVTLYTKSSNEVSVTPVSFKGLKYSYVDKEDSSVKGGANFRSTARTANINIPDGKTYAITIASQSVSDIFQTYEVKVINDASPIDAGSLFKSHTYSNEEPYYTDASGTVTAGVYSKDIYVTGNYTLALPQDLSDGTGAGFWGWSTSGTFNYSGQKITSVNISNGSNQTVYLYDNLGNKVTVQLTGKTIAAPKLKFMELTEDSESKFIHNLGIAGSSYLSGNKQVTSKDSSFVIKMNIESDDELCDLTVTPSTGVTVNHTGLSYSITLSSISGIETEYEISVKDKLLQTSDILKIKTIQDNVGPVFKSDAQFVPVHENFTGTASPYVDTTYNYYSDGTSVDAGAAASDGKLVTVYTTETSAKVLLSLPSDISDDQDIAGWVYNSTVQTEKNSDSTRVVVTLTASAEGDVHELALADKFGNNSYPVKIKVIKDTTAPTFDSTSGKATVVYVGENAGGNDSSTLAKFFGKGNTLYYGTNELKRMYMNVSGLSDDASGVFVAGITRNNTEVPGSTVGSYADWDADITYDITDGGVRTQKAKSLVKGGVARNVFLSFGNSDSSFYLYVRDRAGNVGYLPFNLVKDTTAPSVTWSIDGLKDSDKVTEGNVTYVKSNGSISVSASDEQSGLKNSVVSSVSFDENKKATLDYSDNVGNNTTIQLVSDTTAPAVSNVSYSVSDGKQKYQFNVTEANMKSVIIDHIEQNFEGQNITVTVNNTSVAYSLTCSDGTDGIKKKAVITFETPQSCSGGTVAISGYNGAAYYNEGSWDVSNLTVVDVLGQTGNSSSVNPSILTRAATGVLKAGTFIKTQTTSAVRKIFTSKDEVVEKTKPVSKNSVSSNVAEKISEVSGVPESKAGDVAKTDVIRSVTGDIRRLAEDVSVTENSAGQIGEVITDVSNMVSEKAAEILSEEENEESVAVSQNMIKNENILDKTENDIYNNVNIAKSVAIAVICLLLLTSCLIVVIVVNKNKNKK